jgi:TPR repeat protein
MYGFGKGVPQDNAQALIWLHKAADQGDTQAQYEIIQLTAGKIASP